MRVPGLVGAHWDWVHIICSSCSIVECTIYFAGLMKHYKTGNVTHTTHMWFPLAWYSVRESALSSQFNPPTLVDSSPHLSAKIWCHFQVLGTEIWGRTPSREQRGKQNLRSSPVQTVGDRPYPYKKISQILFLPDEGTAKLDAEKVSALRQAWRWRSSCTMYFLPPFCGHRNVRKVWRERMKPLFQFKIFYREENVMW